jgi:DNA-binding GntR family transcriptional regulator
MSTSLQDISGQRGFSRIAQILRRSITGGELTPRAQLPPIAELARKYDTTAITVRRALRDLEGEGLIRVEHGVGTFVADWVRQFDLLHLPSFAAEMAAHDLRPQTAVLGRELAAHQPEPAVALGQGAAAPVHVLTRLRRVNNRPIVLHHSYLHGSLRAVCEEYSPERSLYELLREATGRAPFAAEESIRAVQLSEEAARSLETEPGAPGFLSARTTYDAAGQPLVYDEAFFPSSRVALEVRRRAGQTQFEYRILPSAGDTQ